MIRHITLIGGILLGASLARGDAYTATILYPLNVPQGISIQPEQVTADATVGYGPPGASTAHALIWSPTNGTVADINPTDLGNVAASQARGESGNQQVGNFAASSSQGTFTHAVLWSGTADSAVDLNPTQLGAFSSLARATDGTQQVGRGSFGTPTNLSAHALLWTGTAASAVDLNPTDFGNQIFSSVALGVGNGQQVGVYESISSPIHAVLWTGTAASAVDLHPSDPSLEFSEAVATSGNQQVGSARANGGNPEAFLWFGTAASAVNLNPTLLPGVDSSIAVGTNGLQQVGYGYDASASVHDDQALVWSGTADSVIDLHASLPSTGMWDFSDASTIDDAGNVFGVASGAFDGVTGYFAVEWSPVPEPSAVLFLTLLGAVSLSRRKWSRAKVSAS
jgi:hypothetical protein